MPDMAAGSTSAHYRSGPWATVAILLVAAQCERSTLRGWLLMLPVQDRTLVDARAEGGGRARGSNQNLEKEYLRLTSLPSVSDVRPPQVWASSLALAGSC